MRVVMSLTVMFVAACSLANLDRFKGGDGGGAAEGGAGGDTTAGGEGGAVGGMGGSGASGGGAVGGGAPGGGGSGGSGGGFCGDGIIGSDEECDPAMVADPHCVDCSVVCAGFSDPVTHHCYELYQGSPSWPDAESSCIALDAHLATVTTPGENTFVLAGLNGSEPWIGGHDRTTENEFEWVSGENWGFTNLVDANSADRDCVWFGDDGTWHLDECSFSGAAYLCEREPAGQQP